MPNHTTNPKVDQSLRKTKKWQEEYALLRSIALELPLTEELKWGWPCYTYEGSNVALIHGFKEYCALLLMKGALLKDPKRILVQQTENVQSARQIRFTSVDQIRRLKPTLKAYLQQAIKAEKAGLKVEFKKTAEFKVPAEFKSTLSTRPDLRKAFAALTPGRQRGYLLHFSSAKQSATREARIAKNLPRILAGKGLDDR
jgi:uncharacterized protein YdeI (YjbR/CyaY-like superfamily)